MISLSRPQHTPPAETAAALLQRLNSSPQPAICQYDAGERVEISGNVLARWGIKVANFFTTELAWAHTPITLYGPLHWKFFTLTLAGPLLGAEVQWRADLPAAEDLGVLCTDRDAEALTAVTAEEIIQVELDTLAQQFSGQLADLAWDFAAEVPAQADQLLFQCSQQHLPTPAAPQHPADEVIPTAATTVLLVLPRSLAHTSQVAELDLPQPQLQPLAEVVNDALVQWAHGHRIILSDAAGLALCLAQEKPAATVIVEDL